MGGDTLKEFIPLTNDRVFNHIFSNKVFAFDFIKSFLNLPDDELIEVINGEHVLDKTKIDDKALKCDTLIELKNYIIDLEMYSIFNNTNVEKSKQYICRIYGTQIKRGEKYKPKPTIQINICKKSIIKEKELISKYGILNYSTGKPHAFGNDLNIYLVELDKVNKGEYNVGISDRLLKHFNMFNADSYEKLNEIAKGDELFMTISECLQDFLNDEETKKLFDHDLWTARENQEEGEKRGLIKGRRQGRRQGRKQGLLQGKLEKQLEIAKKMLLANKPIEEVITFTELSKNDVLNLKKQLA